MEREKNHQKKTGKHTEGAVFTEKIPQFLNCWRLQTHQI